MSDCLLAADTTGEFGSIALIRDGEIAEEVPLHSPDGFAHILFGQIGALLSRHDVDVRSIGCFAAASGPGSFTGVRVGLTCVKGLAETTGRPAVGVSNLRALASFGQGAVRAVVLDARRGEVYGAVYDNELREIHPEVVAKFGDWLASIPGDAEVIGVDLGPFEAMLSGRPLVRAPRYLAGAIGRIAWRDWRAGRAVDPVALDANYVRRSDAELHWKEA